MLNSKYNWNHQLIKFTVIHCHSPRPVVFLYIYYELNVDMRRTIIPALFYAFYDDTNLCDFLKIAVVFFLWGGGIGLVYYFYG